MSKRHQRTSAQAPTQAPARSQHAVPTELPEHLDPAAAAELQDVVGNQGVVRMLMGASSTAGAAAPFVPGLGIQGGVSDGLTRSPFERSEQPAYMPKAPQLGEPANAYQPSAPQQQQSTDFTRSLPPFVGKVYNSRLVQEGIKRGGVPLPWGMPGALKHISDSDVGPGDTETQPHPEGTRKPQDTLPQEPSLPSVYGLQYTLKL